MISEWVNFCHACDRVFPEDFKYCGKCGKPLIRILKDGKRCLKCGTIQQGKFCAEDGTKIPLSGT